MSNHPTEVPNWTEPASSGRRHGRAASPVRGSAGTLLAELARACLGVALLGAAGCGTRSAPPATPPEPFRGMRVTVLIPELPGLREWLDDQAGEWSARTGATVQPTTFVLDGAPDIRIYPSTSTGAVAAEQRLLVVPDELLGSAGYDRKDVLPAVSDQLLTWDRRVRAVALSAGTELLYYRSDLLGDESLGEVFRAEHGRALEPPRTWSDFDELAEFFSRAESDGGGGGYRTVVASAARAVLARAAACGKDPESLSFYFDARSMKPLLSEPPFQEALSGWAGVAALFRDDPSRGGARVTGTGPGATDSEARTANGVGRAERAIVDPTLAELTAGRAVLGIGPSHLAATWMRDPSSGAKIGCAALPGCTRVYLRTKERWRDRPAGGLNRAPLVEAVVASVLETSSQRDAALDFLAFLVDRERGPSAVTAPEYGLGPFRRAQLGDLSAWLAVGWSRQATAGLLRALEESLSDLNAIALLRIAGSDEYHAALEREADAALRGERTVPEALAAAAEAWQAITDARGADEQRRQYRHSIGMPALE